MCAAHPNGRAIVSSEIIFTRKADLVVTDGNYTMFTYVLGKCAAGRESRICHGSYACEVNDVSRHAASVS